VAEQQGKLALIMQKTDRFKDGIRKAMQLADTVEENGLYLCQEIG
jgi:hypothetical protein